jgi:endogenous inhibitor of DNA gyrase (YacG/DUF329 family)
VSDDPRCDSFETFAVARCAGRADAATVDVPNKEDPVGSISITCPTTGEPVRTGMTMERESFYRSVLTGNSVKCPHCGVTHIWSKADAHFD